MPAKSKAQANLMRAAEHGATFPMAREVRASMTPSQMHEFATTKSVSLPGHAASRHPHRNLGTYLHPKKSR